MSDNKQTQKAGDNSSLVQAGVVNNYYGINEARAREIVNELVPQILRNYSDEAQAIAEQRINKFADSYVKKLVQKELLESLRDPSMQFLLMEAEKKAACSDREDDYELLSELLIQRANNNEDSGVRLGVSYSIKILEDVSDEALLGLTIAHSINTMVPQTPNIRAGLYNLDEMFSKLLYGPLPSNNLWIDQLDILEAVRIVPYQSSVSLETIYSDMIPGYTEVGIKKGSSEHEKAISILKEANIPVDILVDHELRVGYVRLAVVAFDRLERIEFMDLLKDGNTNNEIRISRITADQIEAVKQVHDLYDNNPSLMDENIKSFAIILDGYKNIKLVREWWNRIPTYFRLTSVGRVLAHSNALRCDPKLPSIDKIYTLNRNI